MTILTDVFFDQEAEVLAIGLLGKVLRVNYENQWLSARIIETEAYYLSDRASHASLGYTEKRKALFMKPGTIYMYYARGRDSLNVSARGPGNAVLIKSGYPYLEDLDEGEAKSMLTLMQRLNPQAGSTKKRAVGQLCAGQTLLCRSLALTVKAWDQKEFNPHKFYIDEAAENPQQVIQTQRLGIPKGRDEHLLYRFIDRRFVEFCTENPLRKRRSVPVINLNFTVEADETDIPKISDF